MRRTNKILLVLAAVLLVVPNLFVTATSDDSKSSGTEEKTSHDKGTISSKDEVVYAKLSATGERQEIYVVNILDIEKAGQVVDYGPYSSLKNLTDLAELQQKDGEVEFTAPEGKFYYQGNMNEESLPWDVSVAYLLDGKEIDPKELAGKDGHVQIRIATSANEAVDPVFFNNYLLQISLSLNLERYSNIQAPDGMLANAGKNKQVTFTIMPEKEEELVVEADVVKFELDGIDITAIPSSMPIDAPDIDNMTGDMETLTKAILEVNNGVVEFADGVSKLNNGVFDLRDGSKQYNDGISTLDESSSEIVDASESIGQALETLNQSLSGESGDMGLGDLKKLETGLTQIAGGLREASAGLTTLKENYSMAYLALDDAMAIIPEHEITEEQIQQLYMSGANKTVVDQLVETYAAARKAKGTYTAVKEAFAAVEPTLEQVSGGMTEMANSLDTMAEGLSSVGDTNPADSLAQLQEGISALSSNYKAFHSGIEEYTDGISQLATSYQEMHKGIEALSEGTGELENGVGKLHDGTSELYEATKDLPDQMKEEVNQMMEEYDKSDFEPVSFVSPKNEKVNSVQFVFKTASIKVEKPVETEEPVEEETGFWARLKALF
ncbi:hypothetical protein GCM10008967_09520 [Bacillus carboniphilus]|uniref:X-X-X-Leu-X-X-Gly heptad repeat-containing protein n=1 Tax=Bacillus carboniphilus TaxID=86663 RepID=A0ABN0VZG1_9BACI